MSQQLRREEQKSHQSDLVNLSARGQDFLRKQVQLGKLELDGRSSDELFQQSSFLGGSTTNASQDFSARRENNRYQNISQDFRRENSRYANNSLHKSMASGDGLGIFQLPDIEAKKKQQPFKGFLDISIVTQKLRKSMRSIGGTPAANSGPSHFEFGNSASPSPKKPKRGGSNNGGSHQKMIKPVKAWADTVNAVTQSTSARKSLRQSVQATPPIEVEPLVSKVQPKGTRFAAKDTQVQMSPKVLETWIDETLQDAEHLDIPGVILKPEHQKPSTRYGIDRLILINAGVQPETVERIYRSLFVYSVGFYELIKECMQHTKQNYSIVTSIWKVFAILLEYCCRTDYRMLISEISKEHKKEIESLDRDYQRKAEEQANNEKVLKENLDTQQKMCEELQREMMSEKALRLKLEEDFTQNNKNHEEEVQLRLQFESKLNNMHSAHRDLETRYRRVYNDLSHAQKHTKMLNEKLMASHDEITSLKTTQAENESEISQKREQLDQARRELLIKGRQQKENEQRTQQLQDSLDLLQYKTQDCQKENTEMKLKVEVLQSGFDGLKHEKKHMTLELKEKNELLHMYEEKTKTLMEDLAATTGELQSNKREMIGFSEINRERELKIDELKRDLKLTKLKANEFELKLGTLQINYDKMEGQLDQAETDRDELVEKLHSMNKARHEVESKLQDEHDRNKSLQDVVVLKDELLDKRQVEIEDLDRKLNEQINTSTTLEAQKMGVEKAFDLAKTQLNDRIKSLNEVITNEKETRELWIQRYEDEQQNHTMTNSGLLKARSELKDHVLSLKNSEIRLNSANRQIQILQEQNLKYQHQVNEAIARAETLDRELNTQKEILKQMEMTKKDYIKKLKKDLDTVEQRYQHLLNENCMIGEDFRSKAADNAHYAKTLEKRIEDLQDDIKKLNVKMDEKDLELVILGRQSETFQMQGEETLTHFDEMRKSRDHYQQVAEEQSNLAQDRQNNIDRITHEHTEKERQRLEARNVAATQTIIGAKYFDKRSFGMAEMSSSRGSGSIKSGSARQGGRGAGGKQVGGGGRIANRPPPGGGVGRGSGNDSASKQGLAIDTASSASKQQPSINASNQDQSVSPTKSMQGRGNAGGGSPSNRNMAQAQQRSNQSRNPSQNTTNQDGEVPTPRNLPQRGQPTSGMLPQGKRSMDGAVQPNAKSSEGQELLQSAQSASQSQQFKTVDDTTRILNQSSQGELALKRNLQASQSAKTGQYKLTSTPTPPPAAPPIPLQEVIDTTQLQFSRDTSEAGMPIENDVIVERDEKDEEERKTVQESFKKANQFSPPQLKLHSQQIGQSLPLRPPATQGSGPPPRVPGTGLTSPKHQNSGPPSTVQGGNLSPSPSKQDINSQSRIKVTLNQHDDSNNAMNMTDTMGMTGGMDAEAHHMIQQKPTLTASPEVVAQSSPDSTPPFKPPMSEMNQMEAQFKNPSQQTAAILTEQQRLVAVQNNEQERQKQIQRLQQQSAQKPTGNTNIRKLIKSAATRD